MPLDLFQERISIRKQTTVNICKSLNMEILESLFMLEYLPPFINAHARTEQLEE